MTTRIVLASFALISTLMTAACAAGTGAPSTGGSVVTDPLSQTTEVWKMDRPTEDWFATWCAAAGLGSPSLDGTTDVVVDELSRLGDELLTTSSRLGAMPVPTFAGGSAFADSQVTALADRGRALHEAADLWDDGHTAEAGTDIDQAFDHRATALSTLDPVIGDQIGNLSACQSVRATF